MIEVTSHIIYLSNVQLALLNFELNESYYYLNWYLKDSYEVGMLPIFVSQ